MARKKLGKYEIVDRIGRGGMAEVYRGYHAALDRYVAIKLLHPFLADDPEFKDRFENEARNVAKLKHPNIVQVYDFEYDSEGESYYMVMELINGPTLKDQLYELSTTGDHYPISEAIRIVRNAAEALAYAHQRSMIHRDVKPANLMLDEDNRVVLTDFGIAKIVTGTQFTATGGMVGTPAYMSPEQGMGEPGDERSDIYSIGVILYQLVTGQLPFDADSPLAVILKHVNEPLPLPSQIVPDVTPELEQIICKALTKEAEERYQNAAALADDLAQLDETGRLRPRYDTPIRLVADPYQSTYDTPLLTPDDVQKAAPALASKTSPTKPAGLAEAIAAAAIDDTPAIASTDAEVRSQRLRPTWILGLIASVVIIVTFAMLALGKDGTLLGDVFGSKNNTDTPPTSPDGVVVAGADTETPTSTPTRLTSTLPPVSPTPPFVPDTLEPSATRTPTFTPTLTPTFTPSLTPTREESPTFTPSPNLTGTAAVNVFATLAAESATPNMTLTLGACEFEYIVVAPQAYNEPPSINDVNNPRLVPFGQDFSFEIVLRNTGSCPWPEGLRLHFNRELTNNPGNTVSLTAIQNACGDNERRPGTNFATQQQSNFYISGSVDMTEDTEPIVFTGTAPGSFGCYYGVWDLMYPNSDLPIGRPLVLAIRVWGAD